MFALLTRVILLPGSEVGFKKLFTLNWGAFGGLRIWSDAANCALMCFMTGLGVNQTLSSFRPLKSRIFLPALALPVTIICTQFLGAMIVFGFLGYYTQLTNTTFEDLAISGPDLLFVTYPQILQTIPYSNLWLIIFYLVIILLGIDTQFAMVDVIVYAAKDLKLKYKGEYLSSATVTGLVCTAMGIWS